MTTKSLTPNRLSFSAGTNTIKAAVLLLCLAFGSATKSLAQLSQGGLYFGKLGAGDVVVSVGKQDAVNLLVLDYAGRSSELILTGLNQSNSASGLSPKGRSYSFQIQGGLALGTYGGLSFSATKEPVVGPYASKAGGYHGIVQDERLTTGLVGLNFQATGRVLLLCNDVAGIGQVTSTGQVSCLMTDGNVYSFVFRPDPLLLVASSGYISINGRNALSFTIFSNSRSKLSNISTRGPVSPGSPMIAGFVITDWAKTVLIRAVGPTLSQFGVPLPNADTQLQLFSGQNIIASNTDWSKSTNGAEIVSAAAQVGAFPLPLNSRDAALLVTLEPGAYSVQVASQGTTAGEALVEVYQVD